MKQVERSSRKRKSILTPISSDASPTKHLRGLNRMIYVEIPKTVPWNLLMVFISVTNPPTGLCCMCPSHLRELTGE